MSEENTVSRQRHVEVTTKDLPLHCPTPSMPIWCAHPRVFLDVAKTGESLCPYCGTRFTLKGGPVSGTHH